ncbi:hypothetical protein PR048_032398 [Dryococelus australis]|uniref:Uncharacterized protein n=1 Tax=Dryococelus australis TaxID=614101 RepID=A0ABQ9G237_9NEOP|nr:hypothetical protein PR048_032398 [Dryococelus australis]
MSLVGVFSRGSPASPAPPFRHRSIFTLITSIFSQDLAVKSRPNLLTHSWRIPILPRPRQLPDGYPFSRPRFAPPPLSQEQTRDRGSHESARATRRRRARTQLTSLSAGPSWHPTDEWPRPRTRRPPVPSLPALFYFVLFIISPRPPFCSDLSIVQDIELPLLDTQAFTARLPPLRNRLNPRPDHSGLSHVETMPDDATGRRIFSGISRFPHPFILALLHARLISPSSALKSSFLTATQISQLNSISDPPYYRAIYQKYHRPTRDRRICIDLACSPKPGLTSIASAKLCRRSFRLAVARTACIGEAVSTETCCSPNRVNQDPRDCVKLFKKKCQQQKPAPPGTMEARTTSLQGRSADSGLETRACGTPDRWRTKRLRRARLAVPKQFTSPIVAGFHGGLCYGPPGSNPESMKKKRSPVKIFPGKIILPEPLDRDIVKTNVHLTAVWRSTLPFILTVTNKPPWGRRGHLSVYQRLADVANLPVKWKKGGGGGEVGNVQRRMEPETIILTTCQGQICDKSGMPSLERQTPNASLGSRCSSIFQTPGVRLAVPGIMSEGGGGGVPRRRDGSDIV